MNYMPGNQYPPSSTLKMVAAGSSETWVPSCQTLQHYITEDQTVRNCYFVCSVNMLGDRSFSKVIGYVLHDGGGGLSVPSKNRNFPLSHHVHEYIGCY